jgi:arylamine N-acetyltransferase
MNLDTPPLSDDLAERVLAKLGLVARPSPDLEGLTALYRAWGLRVPFDNTRKMIALRAGDTGPLPGAHATDFLEHWLAHGTGGTCWPSSNALAAVLQAAGFNARRVIASMRDLCEFNHASVKVRIDGRDWLVDSSMLLGVPLPLGPNRFVREDPIWPAAVEVLDGTHVVWWRSPPGPDPLPCRLLMDPAPFREYLDGYERSRENSRFNQRLYARRNRPDALVILAGSTRCVLTADGLLSQQLDADELRRSLRDEIGLSAPMIDRWAESGALSASLSVD